MHYIAVVGNSRAGSGPESWKRNLVHGFHLYQQDSEVYEVTTRQKVVSFFRRQKKQKKQKKIILTYTQDMLTLVVVFINIFFTIPHIHVVHGDFYAEQTSKKGLKKLLWLPVNIWLCKRSNTIAVSSLWLKQRLEGKRYLGSIHVIYNSYDFSKDLHVSTYNPNNTSLTCVTITGFTHIEKCRGVLDMVDYLQTISTQTKKRLLIIGGGKYLEQITAKVMNKKVNNVQVAFLGYMPQKEVVELLTKCDIFLYCSYLDNGPIALLEAINAGLPVLSNEIGYTPELLTTKESAYTGLYYDRDSFVHLFTQITEDVSFREQFISAQYTEAKKSFSTLGVQKKWNNLFYQLIDKNVGN